MILLNLSTALLLAEGDQQFDLMGMLFPLLAIGALFYFMIIRPQKSKEQSFKTMIEGLKENDRVVTIGGIHGIVTSVQRDAQIVVLRVDESSGAKIRIGTSAIARVVTDDQKEDKSAG